ncbi:MAG: FAD-dependent oxidoreductase [Cyanophyceae cyanobacterium]
MSKKVVIVGAGPSGLLLAHYLLARDNKYQIDIYERRPDPRTVSVSKSRTFPISLSGRGMNALRKIPGLEEAVLAISVEMWGNIVHQQNGKQIVVIRNKPLFALDRTDFTKVLLNTLQKFANSRLNLYFQCSCTHIDLDAKTANFQNLASTEPEYLSIAYDLLVGADGARSVVRRHFLNTKLFELEQKYVSDDYKSVFLPSGSNEKLQIALEPSKIHAWRLDGSIGVILLHQADGTMSGIIRFPRGDQRVTALKSEAEVLQFFEQNFPQVGQLMPESEAAAFLKRPIATTLTIRCSHYHYSDSALLIGDAAHAVSPALGQGCNCALEDVVVLNQLLNQYADDLKLVLEQFTTCRLADTHAASELSSNTLPLSKPLFIEFIIKERVATVLHRFFPKRFFPPLFEALYESTVSYAEILHRYKNWCSKVKKSQEKLVEAL